MDAVANYFLTWTQGAVGQTHFACALVALVSGGLVLGFAKATRTHSIFGYVYFLAMLAVNVSALLKYDLTGAPNMFHVFAVISLLTIAAGFGFIQAFKRTERVGPARAHGVVMVWSYFGLVTGSYF